jgi:hypothetical protein
VCPRFAGDISRLRQAYGMSGQLSSCGIGTAGYRKRRVNRLSIQSGPGARSSQYFIVRTSTLAEIAGLCLLAHDPHDLGRGEAAEISSDKRAIASVFDLSKPRR